MRKVCVCVEVSAEVSVLCIDMILRIVIYTFETHQKQKGGDICCGSGCGI